MNLKQLRDKRARLLRAAEALKGRDGVFSSDEARADFDAQMTEIDAIDAQIRALEESGAEGQSETILERNPLDPGAPTGARIKPANTEPTDAERGATAERARIEGILTATRHAKLTHDFAERHITNGTTLVEAQRLALEEMDRRGGADQGPRQGPSGVVMGEDPLVHVRAGIVNALSHRVAPSYFKLEEVGRRYRGMTLLDTAKLYLQASGGRVTDLSRMELAGMALGFQTRAGSGYHTTSDFPILLADVANKTLRRAYDEFPVTFTPIVRRTTVPDFKTVNRVQLGDAPNLLKVLEHGEFTRGTISEGREQLAVSTYGRIFAISRQALVNDDTSAFERVPMMFGRAFRVLESDLVWAQITSNPVMGDGNALFSTAHGNIATSDGAIDVTNLGAGRVAMRTQTGLDGQKINVAPRYLLVPAALETVADQVTAPLVPALVSNVNIFAGRLGVIAEPRLDDASPDAWYLAASTEQIDIIELAFLEGQEGGPMVESKLGFDVDGIEFKARHDVTAKVLDWRGLYKNEGDT
jgi:hypothetical protein